MTELYLEELETRHAARQRHAHNAGRHAYTFHRLESTGWGQVEFEDMLQFDLSFIRRPYVAYSYYVEGDALVEMAHPHCAGFVTQWEQDANGLYVGAWVAVSIQLGVWNYQYYGPPDYSTVPPYTIEHDFTFQEVALKDLPLDVEDS